LSAFAEPLDLAANERAETARWTGPAILTARKYCPVFDHNHPFVTFDGACVLCAGFSRMVIRLKGKKRFRFATAQSPLGGALPGSTG
jgi:hypothetical protein